MCTGGMVQQAKLPFLSLPPLFPRADNQSPLSKHHCVTLNFVAPEEDSQNHLRLELGKNLSLHQK